MGGSDQNHALIFFMYLNRLVANGHIQADEYNPKVLMLDSYASGVFLCGRDVNDQPFLGIPSEMMPFFTQIDWVEASICRKIGYIFLEAKDPQTQIMNMAFGIKIRRRRLDVFCIDGHEDINSMTLSMKVFEQDKKDPKQILFADQHELINITLKEINSTMDLGTEMDAEESRGILKKTGVDSTFTPIAI
jgi:hypothetical protein